MPWIFIKKTPGFVGLVTLVTRLNCRRNVMWKTSIVALFLCAANIAVAQEQQLPQKFPNPVPIDVQYILPNPSPIQLPAPAAEYPGSKNMQLMQAAGHLEAAGLADEAKRIRQMIGSENSPSVSVQISMVEVSLEKLNKLGITVDKLVPNNSTEIATTGQASSVKRDDLTGGVKPSSGFGMLKQDDQYFSLLKALSKDGVAKTFTAPTIITESGREACLHTRDHAPISIKKDVPPEEFEKLNKALEKINDAGTTINVKPIILDKQTIQVAVTCSISELDEQHTANIAGMSVPGLQNRSFCTICNIKEGYVAVLSGLSSKQSTLIAIIKAEIVEPLQTAAKPPRALSE
jgi:Flp pilus assembly secretin CpaC